MTRLHDLGQIEAALWRELGRATCESVHGWRRATLATRAGVAADARTVVLREVDPAAHCVRFYSDARSAKIGQIADAPDGTLVCWSHALGWQLRLRLTMDVQTAGLAVTSRWAKLRMTPAAADYLAPLAPGSALDAERPLPVRGEREWFALVTAAVTAVDWLELHAEGNRRALFDATGSRWLSP